jgi:hypothetical protein
MLNLNSAPYFDDYSDSKNFSKILFKPSQAVQARELNQLQTILQKQIQRFGDNVLQQGTIVSGGQITHHASLPYVKIRDLNSVGVAVDLKTLIGRYVRNSAGVTAIVVTVIRGQEATAPDLTTLYVKYTNSGTSTSSSTFIAGDSLTIYDAISTDAITITVALSAAVPIGVGYGVTIDEGVVYQAGFFNRTAKQFLVITKYNNQPDNLSVGFDTTFDIVTADDDASLYNNANGFTNFNAPGADRLRSNANAIVISKADAQTRGNFLSIIEFTQGLPYKLDATTQYNVVEQNLARRTFEEAGNYVVNRFALNTKSSTINLEPTLFQAVVSPGLSYLNGYRISTIGNFTQNVNKATTTRVIPGTAVSVDYGNYITVNRINGDVSGLIGSTVNLNDTAQTFAIGATINIIGGNIGFARVRGIEYVTRDSSTTAKLYLFDVTLNPGYSALSVQSVNGNNFAANVVGTATLVDAANSRAIFNAPTSALKAVSNISIVSQRGNWGTVTSNTSGYVSYTVSGTDTFETAGTLTRDQLNNLIVTPVANTVGTSARTGTLATTSGSVTITGTGTTFTTDIVVGDWISIGAEKLQIATIASNTSATATFNSAVTGSGLAYNNFYPARYPVRALSGSISPDRLTLTLNVTQPIPSTNFTSIIRVRSLVAVASKSINRNVCARVSLDTNLGGVNGPWAVGHSDVIRLRGVYKAANTTFISSDSGVVDVTPQFYIDANHDTDFLGTGYLYKKSTSPLVLAPTDRLLIVFDIATTSSNGLRTIGSYPINDGLNLAASTSTMNTIELPEVFGQQDAYYDVRDAFDFRPTTANTIAINVSQATAAINPTEPAYAARYASIGVFPAPHSTIVSDVEYYLARFDRVIIDTSSAITIVSGQPGTSTLPVLPKDSLTINTLSVPPYPSIPNAMSADLVQIADTKVSNEKVQRRRLATYTIRSLLTPNQIAIDQPRRYTMQEIGSLDARLSNIEYYVALNKSELDAKRRLVPSVISPGTDRFKFGLFVDPFNDSSLADLDQPQYAASIVDGVLQPKTDNVVIQMDPPFNLNRGGLTTLPYSSVPLIQQLIATSGPIVPPVPIAVPAPVADVRPVYPPDIIPILTNTVTGTIVLTPPPPPPPTVIVPPPPAPVVVAIPVLQQTIVSHQWYTTDAAYDVNGAISRTENITMSTQAAPATVYFGSVNRQIAVEIYQGRTYDFPLTTPILDTSNAVALIGSDASLTSDLGILHALTKNNFNGRVVSEGGGKISWAHNPANGQYYKIKIYQITNINYQVSNFKGFGFGPSIFYIAKIAFATDGYTVVDTTPPFSTDSTGVVVGTSGIKTPINFGYDGVTSISPSVLTINSTSTSTGATQYYLGTQTFRIVVFGLKPSTSHYFFFDGTNYTADCNPIGTTTASGGFIISDNNGNIVVDFLCDPAKGLSKISDMSLLNVANTNTPSPKVFTFQSPDGTSIVDGIIGVAPYAVKLNTPPDYSPIARVGYPKTVQTEGIQNTVFGGGGGFREYTHINSD